MSTAALLTSLYEQKAAIDREFFAALVTAPLSPENRHIAIRTLNHIHTVDRIFAAHLRGQAHGFTASNTADTPTLDELRASVEQVDGWYVDYVRALAPEQFEEVLSFRFTDGDAGRMSREEILACHPPRQPPPRQCRHADEADRPGAAARPVHPVLAPKPARAAGGLTCPSPTTKP